MSAKQEISGVFAEVDIETFDFFAEVDVRPLYQSMDCP
jgi:hypothetical protein